MKQIKFRGEVYTNEDAEKRATSFSAPAGFMRKLHDHCKWLGVSQQEFLYKAIENQMQRDIVEAMGGAVVEVQNPAENCKLDRNAAVEMAAAFAALELDKNFGCKTGIEEAVYNLFTKHIAHYAEC